MKNETNLIFLAYLLLLPLVARGETPPEISMELSKISPISIEMAFTGKTWTYHGQEKQISIEPSNVPMLRIGSSNLLGFPVKNEKTLPFLLRIRSYVVQASGDRYTMYYPVVSLVGNNNIIYKTIRPKNEFNFDGETLINEFEIPENSAKIIIHTHEDFYKSDFVGKTYLTDSRLGPIPFLFAGLIGALAGRISQGSNNEFSFSEVGVISIEQDR